MASPWYESVPLIVSNAVFIPVVVIAYATHPVNSSAPLSYAILSFVVVCSSLFHACGSTLWCALGGTLYTWTVLDYIFADGCIPVLFVTVAANGHERTGWRAFWTETINISYFFTVILIIVTRLQSLSEPLDVRTSMLIILIGAVAILLKVLIVSDGDVRVFVKFTNRYVLIGLLLFVLAVICFVLQSYYFFFHSLWHVLAASGFGFVIYGNFRDVPGLLRSLQILEPYQSQLAFLGNDAKIGVV